MYFSEVLSLTLQFVHKLKPDDPPKRFVFCKNLLALIKNDEDLPSRIIFVGETTFHVCGKVNTHNVRFWGSENPCCVIYIKRDSTKLNVFCAILKRKVYGPFFFQGNTVTGNSYLDMLIHWLFPQLEEKGHKFFFQQDGAPPHWNLNVYDPFNEQLAERRIGRTGDQDNVFCKWPPRSPDLTVTSYGVT